MRGMSGCHPVGSALPARRDSSVSIAAAAPPSSSHNSSVARPIIIEAARDRLYEIFERQMMPQDVKGILQSTLHGDLALWQRLCQAMFDSWPMLQKCLAEVQREVRGAPWKCRPWCLDGRQPDASAAATSARAHAMLWGARPRPAYAEGALEDLMDDLVAGYFTGISVSEPRWENLRGEWRPAAYRHVPARYYGYRGWGGEEDRLMLCPQGGITADFIDFPEHRFLIAIHGGHPGHPLVSAPIRVLTGWWLAAVYGLEWFMKFAQLFGVPFRWATYSDDSAKEGLAEMMGNLGNAGWGIARQGTTLEFPQNSVSAQSLPQAELLRLADEQCQQYMLGQTLTSGVSKDGGSRALGEVHAETKGGVVRGIADFVGGIITRQLIPAWNYWNSGNNDADLPEFFPDWAEPTDLKAEAERMDILINRIRLPMEADHVYDALGVSKPATGATVFIQPEPHGARGEPATGKVEPHETKAPLDASLANIAAAYQPDQKRSPKGSHDGGRWVDQGGGGGGSSSHHDSTPSSTTRRSGENKLAHAKRLDREEAATTANASAESRRRIPAAKDLLGGMDFDHLVIQDHPGGFVFEATESGGRRNTITGRLTDGVLKIGSMFPGRDASHAGMSTKPASIRLMKQLLDGAEAAGIKKITTTGGRGGEDDMTGYLTWPYMGFDLVKEEIPRFKSVLPEHLRAIADDPPSLRNVVSTTGGRNWWREHGYGVDLEFNLGKVAGEDGEEKDSPAVVRFEEISGCVHRTKAYQSSLDFQDDHDDGMLIRAMDELYAEDDHNDPPMEEKEIIPASGAKRESPWDFIDDMTDDELEAALKRLDDELKAEEALDPYIPAPPKRSFLRRLIDRLRSR